ncbi:hypothetical protein [Paenibacillus sp. S25]|uniref:hypothetical protein n=1 Tax=Paenibacillus sp. S25 TaxID=2823905 RepID=UPI0021ABC1C1|nr:hypothetical protein [Paenibacillus sp. S25]
MAQDERASVSPEILTLEGLFKRYYTARQAAGAAERTLEGYQNKIPHPHHMCANRSGNYRPLSGVLQKSSDESRCVQMNTGRAKRVPPLVMSELKLSIPIYEDFVLRRQFFHFNSISGLPPRHS